jgi:hypothetical protein
MEDEVLEQNTLNKYNIARPERKPQPPTLQTRHNKVPPFEGTKQAIAAKASMKSFRSIRQ